MEAGREAESGGKGGRGRWEERWCLLRAWCRSAAGDCRAAAECGTVLAEVNSNMKITRERTPTLFERKGSVIIMARVPASMKWARLRSFHHSSIAARTTPVVRFVTGSSGSQSWCLG